MPRVHPYKVRIPLCPQRRSWASWLVLYLIYLFVCLLKKCLTALKSWFIIGLVGRILFVSKICVSWSNTMLPPFCFWPINLVYPHCPCRWEEENQSNWQWAESCLEWSKWGIKANCKVCMDSYILEMRAAVASVWNEMSLWLQVLEFDLKGSPLDASSFINVVVKDYETIGKDK